MYEGANLITFNSNRPSLHTCVPHPLSYLTWCSHKPSNISQAKQPVPFLKKIRHHLFYTFKCSPFIQ